MNHTRCLAGGLMLLAVGTSSCKTDAAGSDASSTSEDAGSVASTASATTTGAATESTSLPSADDSGEPFDTAQWVGRYHYDDPFQTFGELQPPQGEAGLGNFEIFPDLTAHMSYENCNVMMPRIEIEYRVEPVDASTVQLLPGEGESSLRYRGGANLDGISVTLHECSSLEFSIMDEDVQLVEWWRPGAACWVDRCETVSPVMFHIDYCEGEDPAPCP